MPDSQAQTKLIKTSLPGRLFNRLLTLASKAGLSMAGSCTLTVVGRKSGKPRTTPVNPMELGGATYLVAPRGTTEWVRNLRVAGEGELKLGRKTTPFRAEEVSDAEKLPILKAYLDKWAWEVRSFFELEKDPSDDDIRGVAHLHPVFRVLPSSD